MFVKSIKLQNYRSYKNVDIALNDFSLVVGANAAGKSNLIAALKFLRDASLYGFTDAISLQGGVEFMGNLGSEEPLALEYDFDAARLLVFSIRAEIGRHQNSTVRLKPTLLRYKINISHQKKDFKITQSAVISYTFVEHTGKSTKELGVATVAFSCRKSGVITAKHSPMPKIVKDRYGITNKEIEHQFSPYFTFDEDARKRFFDNVSDIPIINQSAYVISGVALDSFSFFDFDPHLAKLSSKFAGKKELEEDGSNFNVAMNYVLANDKQKERFLNILADFLPFIENLKIDQSLDRALISVFSEDGGNSFPSYAMSDGSMYLACLVLGVSFSTKSLLVIEEPEKYIHPGLAIKIIEYLMANSKSKQIIVTSHSPQIVKYSGIENIIIVCRKDGESVVKKAEELPHVKDFIENDVGLDQIFSDNLLAF